MENNNNPTVMENLTFPHFLNSIEIEKIKSREKLKFIIENSAPSKIVANLAFENISLENQAQGIFKWNMNASVITENYKQLFSYVPQGEEFKGDV